MLEAKGGALALCTVQRLLACEMLDFSSLCHLILGCSLGLFQNPSVPLGHRVKIRINVSMA